MTKAHLESIPEEYYNPGIAPGTGCASVFLLVIFSFASLLITGFTGETYGNTAGIVTATICGVIWVVWVVSLLKRNKARRAERTGVDVLRTILDFRLPHEHYGVGLTAFCRPDSVAAGQPAALLIFAQNYANRPRRVFLKLPKRGDAGLHTPQMLSWDLSPGQAVVYRRCFQVPAATKPGLYIINMRVAVKLPKGQGARLIPRKQKGSSLTVTRVRTATFGLDVRNNSSVDHEPLDAATFPPPQLLSLYTPALSEPRFDVLEQVSNLPPTEPISTPEIMSLQTNSAVGKGIG